jgi:GNAT superfamily N-acetyltransferase
MLGRVTPSAAVTVRPTAWDAPESVALRTAQQAEIRAMYGPDSEPGVPPSAADIEVFLVAADAAGQPVGCGGLRRLGPDAAEVKRMFVVPERRGAGVADAVLLALHAEALARGVTVLRLETGPLQLAAIRFYGRHGYRPIPNFGHYADHPDSQCFERVL